METRINQHELTSPELSKKEDLLVISDIHSNIKALQLVRKMLTDDVCGKKINSEISGSTINMPVDWYQKDKSKEEFDESIFNNKLDNSKSLINDSKLIIFGNNHPYVYSKK